MIISFQHKGLRLFYETGSTKGIHADHAKRLGISTSPAGGSTLSRGNWPATGR